MCPPEGLENTPLRPQSEVTKAHSLGSEGCGSDRGQKWLKNTKNPFFPCFRPYVGQPHGHIG